MFLGIFSCSTDLPTDLQIENTTTEDKIDPVPGTEMATTALEENFLLDKERKMTNLILSPSEYNKFLAGEGDLKLVSEKAYQYFQDDFDFLIILSIEATQPPDLFYGRSTGVQNSVEGLGGDTYSNTVAYGSDERLKSIIYMPRSDYVKTGPFLHEIAHVWANKNYIPTTLGGHWGYSSAGGQLGGFDELEHLGGGNYRGRLNDENGFGTFANGGNTVPYSNLELYLMGLIGADELESVYVAVNPEKGSGIGEFTADSIEEYTAASLIAENGERVPSHTNSQKAFKALVVIISTEMLSQEKTNTLNSDLENFSRASLPDASWGNLQNFWLATKGKASFDFTLDQATLK